MVNLQNQSEGQQIIMVVVESVYVRKYLIWILQTGEARLQVILIIDYTVCVIFKTRIWIDICFIISEWNLSTTTT